MNSNSHDDASVVQDLLIALTVRFFFMQRWHVWHRVVYLMTSRLGLQPVIPSPRTPAMTRMETGLKTEFTDTARLFIGSIRLGYAERPSQLPSPFSRWNGNVPKHKVIRRSAKKRNYEKSMGWNNSNNQCPQHIGYVYLCLFLIKPLFNNADCSYRFAVTD